MEFLQGFKVETVETVQLIITIIFVVCFFLALAFKSGPISTTHDVQELVSNAMGGTLGVLALWAAFDQGSWDILPVRPILIASALASLTYTGGRIIEGRKRNKLDDDGVDIFDIAEESEPVVVSRAFRT